MTQPNDVWTQFEALRNTEASVSVSAIRCGKDKQHLLIKGSSNEPVLLLSSVARKNPRAPIALKNVSVLFDVLCETTNLETGASTTGSYCKFICASESLGLHPYFVQLLAAIANSHLGELIQSQVDEIVDALLELFKKQGSAQKMTVAGLWGELLLIHASTNPGTMVDAWHISNTDSFDFAFSDARLEVKSTERSVREHEFSLAQVRGGRLGDAIVSVRLVRSAAGSSILDLAKNISTRISSEHQQKLWRLVLETLGDGIESVDDSTFDVTTAVNQLIFLPSASIPAPFITKVDALVVTDVRFRTNISNVPENLRIENYAFLNRAQ